MRRNFKLWGCWYPTFPTTPSLPLTIINTWNYKQVSTSCWGQVIPLLLWTHSPSLAPQLSHVFSAQGLPPSQKLLFATSRDKMHTDIKIYCCVKRCGRAMSNLKLNSGLVTHDHIWARYYSANMVQRPRLCFHKQFSSVRVRKGALLLVATNQCRASSGDIIPPVLLAIAIYTGREGRGGWCTPGLSLKGILTLKGDLKFS